MRRRVLIAGDSAGQAADVEHVLTRFGFARPTIVPDFDHALRSMREETFDLVIVSVHDIAPVQLLSLEREIRKNGASAVIGTSPSADSGLILRAMRAGVHEFLVCPPSAEELAAAVERLTRRGTNEKLRGEVVAVYSAKGGLGCTSIAVNLAQAFAATHMDTRIALADLVVSGGDVRMLLNLKPAYDLGDLIAKGTQVDGELLNSLLTPCQGGVWALPTSENPELNEPFDAATIASIIDLLRTNFPITVIDCEHHLSERLLAIFDASNKIVLVTHLGITPLKSTQRSLSIFRRLGYDNAKICVVANRYLSADVLPLKDAETLLECPIYWTLPNDYELSDAALTRGEPVILANAASKLARSYHELALKLSGKRAATTAQASEREGNASRLRKFFRIDKGVGNVT